MFSSVSKLKLKWHIFCLYFFLQYLSSLAPCEKYVTSAVVIKSNKRNQTVPKTKTISALRKVPAWSQLRTLQINKFQNRTSEIWKIMPIFLIPKYHQISDESVTESFQKCLRQPVFIVTVQSKHFLGSFEVKFAQNPWRFFKAPFRRFAIEFQTYFVNEMFIKPPKTPISTQKSLNCMPGFKSYEISR